ncbi:MAG: SurA N-terminal domain-containing protein [Leptospirales bacterium]|nr:SurA N-terminal domain-containing protein [Leptospirales bacterium]
MSDIKDIKNSINKYLKYIVIGAFLAIIIISFGMPDTISHCGGGRSTSIAIVNREKISYNDFQIYWDIKFSQVRSDKDNKVAHYILDNYIREILFIQKANSSGFKVTEDRIARTIKNLPDFKNETGQFDPDRLKGFLRHLHLDLSNFTKFLEKNLTYSDYIFLITMGEASSKEDALTKNMIDNSVIQIEYSFLSFDDIKKRYKNELVVSDEDIDNEINNSDVKISDPSTDRERIKIQLEDKKLDNIKNDIINKINSASTSDASFAYANSILNGKIGKSAKFKIGEPVKTDEKDSKELFMNKSAKDMFTDKCLALKIGKTSPAIVENSGIYIFSPMIKVIPSNVPNEEILNNVLASNKKESFGAIANNALRIEYENSKIIKNLKTD